MEETGLRDLMRIIWSGKWLIAIVTVVCIVLGSLYAVVMMDNSYHAEALLRIAPVQNAGVVKDIDSIAGIIDFISLDPGMALEDYLEQITTSPVLSGAVKKLIAEYGLNYSVNGLKGKISIRAPKNTNLVYLQVTDSNRENAIRIANAVSESFMMYVTEVLNAYAQDSLELIKEQLESEEQTVLLIMNELTDFLSQPKSVKVIKYELEGSLKALNTYKNQLMSLEISLLATEAGLTAARDSLEELPPYLTIVKAVGDDAVLSEVMMENGSGNFSDIADIVMVEQIVNGAYVKLTEKINNYEISMKMDSARQDALEVSVNKIQSDIETLEEELVFMESEYTIINNKLKIAETARNLYRISLKTAEGKVAANIGEKSVRLVAEADYASEDSPGKVLVILLAGFAGLLLGIFGAFIMNVFKEEKKAASGR